MANVSSKQAGSSADREPESSSGAPQGASGGGASRSPVSSALRQLSLHEAQALLSPGNGEDPDAIAQRGLSGASSPVGSAAASRVTSLTGVDVSGTRVHTGPEAQGAAAALGADGFTVGRDVGLATTSPSVLYHELGHVAQQSGGSPAGVMAFHQPAVGPSGDLEQEADAVADAAMAGDPEAEVSPTEVEAMAQRGRAIVKKLPLMPHQKARLSKSDDPDHAADNEAIQEEGDALAYLAFDLGAASDGLRAAVVTDLDGDNTLSRLIKRAGYRRLWQTPETSAAIVGLLRARDPAKATEDIKQLVLKRPFDLQVNRYEARLAWELLMTLPEADREALLDGVPTALAEPEAVRQDNAGDEADTEETAEEKEQLEEARAAGTPPGDKPVKPTKPPRSLKREDEAAYDAAMTLYEADLAQWKQDVAAWREEKRAYRQEMQSVAYTDRRVAHRIGNADAIDKNLSVEYKASSAYDTYSGDQQGDTPDGAHASEASDRESLLTQAMDPALWEGDGTRLRPVLQMVVQADEEAFVAPYVSEYWGLHESLLMGLGFLEDGSFLEHVTDDTATTALRRTLAAIGTIFDVLAVVGAVGRQSGAHALDLKQVETAFLGKYGGVHLADAASGDLHGVLVCLMGSDAAVSDTLALTSWSEEKLFEVLLKGTAARDEIDAAVGGVQPATESEAGDAADASELASANQLVVSGDDRQGLLALDVPLLALSGQQLRSGDMTIKMGPGALVGGHVEVKRATARDGSRYTAIAVEQVRLTDIAIITPEGMTMIGLVELGGLHMRADASDAQPATLLGQIASDIQWAVMHVLEVSPIVRLVEALGDLKGSLGTGMALATDAEGLQIGFSELTVSGVADSKGNHIDSVSVGETDLWIAPAMPPAYDWQNRKKLERTLKRYQRQQKHLVAETTRRAGNDGAIVRNQRERLAWVNEEIPKVEAALALNTELAPVRQEMLTLEAELLTLRADDKADKKVVTAKEARLEELRGQIEDATSIGASIEEGSHLGRTEVRGVDWAGTEAGSIVAEEITFDAVMDAGDVDSAEMGSVAGHTEAVVVTDVAYGGGQRRDLQIPEQIKGIRDAATTDDRELTRDELDAIATLEEELAYLAPFVAEYETLRGRLTDKANPMTVEERTRYQQLVERLAATPSVTVGSVTLTDVDVSASATDIDAASADDADYGGVAGGLSAGEVRVRDLGLHEQGELTTSGSTTVDEIVVQDASVDFLGGSADGLLGVEVAGVDVTGVHMQGTGEVVTEQIAEVEAELAGAQETLWALMAIPAEQRTEDDNARLEAVQAQIQGLETRLHGEKVEDELAAIEEELAALKAIDDRELTKSQKARIEELLVERADTIAAGRGLQGQVDVQAALQTLVAQIEASFPTYVGSDGVDRSRGYSLQSAWDAIQSGQEEVDRITHGSTGGSNPYEVCLDNADRLIATYADGVGRLTQRGFAQENNRDAARTASKDDDAGLGEASDLAFAEQDLNETVGTLEAARAQLQTWETHKLDLEHERSRVQATIDLHRGYVPKLQALYGEAGSAGVDWTAAGLDGLTELSPFMVQQLAVGQLDGWKSTSIDAIRVADVNVEISGVLDVLEESETSQLHITSGGDGPMVGNVTVEGVKRGDDVVLERLSVDDIDADVTMVGDDMYLVDPLSLGTITLQGVAWESPDYAITAPGQLVIEGVEVSAVVHTVGGETKGSITSVRIARVSSPDRMDVRYGDYLLSFGTVDMGRREGEVAGKGALAAVELSDYDLETGAMDVKLGALNTTGMQADLGAGMEIGARNLSCETISVGAVVSEEEARRAEARGEGDRGEAAAYSIDLAGLAADDLAVKLQESGLDMSVSKLRDGAISGFEIDLHSERYSFDKISASTLKLGPMSYVTPDMSVLIEEGIDLQGVWLSGYGSMDLSVLELTRIHADHANLRKLRYSSVTGSGGRTQANLELALADNLDIRDYVLYMEADPSREGTMRVDAENASVDGLSAQLTDRFSSTRFAGDFAVDSLSYASLVDDQGRAVSEIGFSNLGSTSDVKVDQSSHGTDWKGDSVSSSTSMTLTDLEGASGDLRMVSDLAGDGDTMSFSDLSLGQVTLGSLDWSGSGAGSATGVKGGGVTVADVIANGFTVTRMVEREGMPLPETDVHLTSLQIGAVDADWLTISLNSTVDGTNGDTTIQLGAGTTPYRAASIRDIDITGVDYIGGKLTDGTFDIGHLDARADIQHGSTELSSGLKSLLQLGSRIEASGILVDVQQGGDHIDATVQELALSDVGVRYEFASGHWVDVKVPRAMARGLDIDYTAAQTDNPDVLSSAIGVHLPELTILQDGSVEFFMAQGPPAREQSEMTAEQRRDALDGTEDLWAALAAVDFTTLLDNLNGEVTADTNVCAVGRWDLDVPTRLTITDGDLRLGDYFDQLNAAVSVRMPIPGGLIPGPEIFRLDYDIGPDGLPRVQIRVGPDVNPLAWRHTVNDAHPSTIAIGEQLDYWLAEKDQSEARAALEEEIAEAGGEAAFDAEAEGAYDDRMQELAALASYLEQLKDTQARFVNQHGYENGFLKRQIAATERKLGTYDAGPPILRLSLHGIHGELSLGSVQGAQVGEGMSLGFDDLTLKFHEIGPGQHVARVETQNLGFGMGQTEDGQSSVLGVNLGEADIRARLEALFGADGITLGSGFALENPIKAKVLAGTSVKDFRLTYASLYTRQT